jgi:hypothetical protein
MAWDAVMELTGPEGVRRVPIKDFYIKAKVVDLRPAELQTAILIPKESYDDNLTILKYLNDETNYPISFEYKPLTDGFEAVHSIITAGCKELKILITNIYKEQYSLTYCLKTPRAYAYIKLSFNGQGIITTLAPYSSIGADDQELNYLLEIISHLWQR